MKIKYLVQMTPWIWSNREAIYCELWKQFNRDFIARCRDELRNLKKTQNHTS